MIENTTNNSFIIIIIIAVLSVLAALIYSIKFHYFRKEIKPTQAEPEKISALFYATTLLETFSMERSILIQASPEKINDYLLDFKQWAIWSPWECRDPDLVRTFSGSPKGKDAVYDWSGNDKVGTGRMKIEDVLPDKIVIKIDLIKPFEAHNTGEFSLKPQKDNCTEVTWTMFGPLRYVNKVMSEASNMDKIVGPDFEAGLAKLKAAAEL